MLRTVAFSLALLTATVAPAAQDFQLGLEYSATIPTAPVTGTGLVATAMDAQGDVYVLINGSTAAQPNGGTATIVKWSATGVVVYQTSFASYAAALAVDSSGNAYVAVANIVAKINPSGTTVYQTTVGGEGMLVTALALDNAGRLYLTGTVPGGYLKATSGAFEQSPPFLPGFNDGFVVRLTASGAIDYATYLGVSHPAAIAVDPSGTAFVLAGSSTFSATVGAYLAGAQGSLLVRLSADGSHLIYATYTGGGALCCVAVDSAGDAVVALQGQPGLNSVVMRFNPQGTGILFSTAVPGLLFPAGVAVDSAGNMYVTSTSVAHNYAPKSSLAPCVANSSALTVLDGSGNILDASYLPGLSGNRPSTLAMSVGPNSTVAIVGVPDSAAGLLLTLLSPNVPAQTVQLVCLANAANYLTATDTAVAGGEMVALFGQGLGPAEGALPQVTLQSGFPLQLAGVQVTFNGMPAPLLYAQDGQINAIAPWALKTGQTAQICASYNGAQTNCIARTVVDADPGVFLSDGVHAYATNQDGSVNSASHPAKSGSVVTIYATGLGAISPLQPDGSIVTLPLPVNVLPVTVEVPGLPIGTLKTPILSAQIPETVEYAGPAPFEVAGMSQINFIPIQAGSLLLAGQGSCPVLVYVQ